MRKPTEDLSYHQRTPEPVLKGRVEVISEARSSRLGITFIKKIGSTCDLGVQSVALTPGASSTCGGGNCSCCSSCCW